MTFHDLGCFPWLSRPGIWSYYIPWLSRKSGHPVILLNETTDQQHRCLLNLAGKPSLIVGEIVACHSWWYRWPNRVTTLPGKSWNLVRPFSRPGKSWKTAKVMESHGKWWCPGIFCTNALNFCFCKYHPVCSFTGFTYWLIEATGNIFLFW